MGRHSTEKAVEGKRHRSGNIAKGRKKKKKKKNHNFRSYRLPDSIFTERFQILRLI